MSEHLPPHRTGSEPDPGQHTSERLAEAAQPAENLSELAQALRQETDVETTAKETSADELRSGEQERKELFDSTFGYDPSEDPQTARLKLENQRLLERLRNDVATREMRTLFARRIYDITRWWLRGVFLVIVLHGFHIGFSYESGPFRMQPFALSETVLTALIAATGAIGLLAIVLRNLFPGKEADDEAGRKK